jgi:hypothetical protein
VNCWVSQARPFQHLPTHYGAVDVALRVDAKTFGTRMLGSSRFGVLDEGGGLAPLALPMRIPFLMPINSWAPVSGPDSESVT